MRRLAQRPTQGLMIRLKNHLFLQPDMIGRQSYLRRYIEGKTKTHTRAMYTDHEYLNGIVYLHALHGNWQNDTHKLQVNISQASKLYTFLSCPCCLQITAPCLSGNINADANTLTIHDQYSPLSHDNDDEHSGLYGNSRHYLFYCHQENITNVRILMTQLLEDQLTCLMRMASHWGKLGFSTLLRRSITALVKLDRSPYHNAHLRITQYSKLYPSLYACLSSVEWISLIESQAEHMSFAAQTAFLRRPLVHQFGFIPANAYTKLELEDGEYSPCDLIPMGIIPLSLQVVIETFAFEIGQRNTDQASKKKRIPASMANHSCYLPPMSNCNCNGCWSPGCYPEGSYVTCSSISLIRLQAFRIGANKH